MPLTDVPKPTRHIIKHRGATVNYGKKIDSIWTDCSYRNKGEFPLPVHLEMRQISGLVWLAKALDNSINIDIIYLEKTGKNPDANESESHRGSVHGSEAYL